MWLRQAVFRWLIPAAFVLPLWLLIGWAVTGAGGWAFLLLIIAMPSVFAAQLVLTLLVRVRASVRTTRAVSWWDAAGFLVWHALTIVVGLFPKDWFGLALTGAIAAAIAVFWISLWQLWREARDGLGMRPAPGRVDADGDSSAASASPDVFIVHEKPLER